MRRLVTFLPVAIFALLLFCLPSWAGSENAEPIRIGVPAPLSGPFASGGPAFRILDRYSILPNGYRIPEEKRNKSDTEARLRAACRRLFQRAPRDYGGGENR